MRLPSAPITFCVGLAIGSAAMFIGAAGPLNPAVGPVASTYKTLTEVEPRIAINATNTPGDADSLYRITRPGAYYLTDNITGAAARSGIEIAAPNVTIDLNGFMLQGVAGSLDGIRTPAAGLRCLEVCNGTIRDWGGDGIDFNTGLAVTISISNVMAFINTGAGINAGQQGVLRECVAANNGGGGIIADQGFTIDRCVASLNTGDGISVSFACSIVGCVTIQNTAFGISVTGNNCSISNCTSNGNDASGISAGSRGRVEGCTADSNDLDGILVGGANLVLNNECSANGLGVGAGIHATGADNRIEGNSCTGADTGIRVDVAGNFIVRNSCASNTVDWQFAANNVHGPILDRRAPASGAVAGFAAASSLASTDPGANYSY